MLLLAFTITEVSAIDMPINLTTFQEKVRTVLTQQIAKRGHAPSNDQVATSIGYSRQEVDETLLALYSSHSLLLHLHKLVPWVVHPFTLYPASC
jgi:DNA-directed RNA polymerase specialized sigma subunit